MNPSSKKIRKNKVLDRFLPVPQSVLKGLEPEPKITDFTLIKEIGNGSFGTVLLVQHNVTQAQYAIKAIDKRIKDNIEEKPYFRREMEIMYQINHPNVVKLYGHFEDNTYCYFVMEYIPRGNLYSLVPKNGKPVIGTQTVVSLIKDVISALYYLHHMTPPIIHRDIKPENILIDEQMRAKLSDFGWSNYLRGNYKRTTICGTPIYLAPEIINNFGHDEKIDIWCVGVLMFELMTGEAPWEGDDVTTVKRNISQMRIKWPKNMDPDAKDIILKILRYMPEERPNWRTILSHKFFTKYYPDAVNCLQPPNNSQHRLYLISKDHPLTYNNLVYSTYTNYQPYNEIIPTPSLPVSYASITPSLNSDYSNPQKFSMVPKISYIQNRATAYSLSPLTSRISQTNFNNSNTTTDYIIPPLMNSVTPQNNYTLPRNTLRMTNINNNNIENKDYNIMGTIYNVTKLNSSLTQPSYNLSNLSISNNTNNNYSVESLNTVKIKEMYENQERINELVRRTNVLKSRKSNNYGINNDYNLSLNNSNRSIIYQTQYRSQRPVYYSGKNLYSIISNNKDYDFSLSNNRLSNLNDNLTNYSFFRADPEVLKWKQQEGIRRESERAKISSLMHRYGMSMTPSYKNKYNFI